MPITLPTTPRRQLGEGTRGSARRGVRLPTAADVQQVSFASDPGLSVPLNVPRAQVSPLEGIGSGLIDVGTGIERSLALQAAALDRQQKQHDANTTARHEIDYARFGDEERQRLKSEQIDLSLPWVYKEHELFFDSLQEQTALNLRDERVSEAAIARSMLRIEKTKNTFLNKLGLESLAAADVKSEAVMDEIRNVWVRAAMESPWEVEEIIADLSRDYSDFGALGAGKFAAARQDIIEAAIRGYIDRGDVNQASDILAEFSQHIDPDTSKSLSNSFPALRKKQLVNRVLAEAENISYTLFYTRLLSGKFEDSETSQAWRALNPDDRLEVQSTVIDVINQRRSLLKATEDAQDADDKENVDRIVADLYLTQDLDERKRLLEQIRKARVFNPEEMLKLDRFVAGSAGFATLPNPDLTRSLLRELEEGDSGPDEVRAQQTNLTAGEFDTVMKRARVLRQRGLKEQLRQVNRDLQLPDSPLRRLTAEQQDMADQAESIKRLLTDWVQDNPDAGLTEIRAERISLTKEARSDIKIQLDVKAHERVVDRGAKVSGFKMENTKLPTNEFIKTLGKIDPDDARLRSLLSAIRQMKERDKSK